ncbi:MAG: NHL repeat-containing protein [Clostridiales bacterium]|nr:NHL repeat-containing protein [Clostridiales bacterium]
MKKLRKFFAVGFAVLIVYLSTFPVYAGETLPYITYNYDFRNNIVYTPAAYVPEKSISGVNMGEGVGVFNNPQGLFVDESGLVYVADTGNNRIVVLNSQMSQALEIIDTFENNGAADTFSGPYGVCVSANNELYIADTGNFRVVVLTNEPGKAHEFVRVIENPQSDLLGENFSFAPLRITVDYADRVYCVVRGMFQGLMVFEGNDFTGFFGTIEVTVSAWQKFWRFFSTKEQRANQILFIPTEFTGVDMDDEGFVYASHLSPNANGQQAVRRLNPKGEDVIKKGVNNHVGGDLQLGEGFSDFSGPSNFIDIAVRDKGIYSLLDSKRGRVFTYDYEGNILYIFGGLGTQAGTFRVPSAIDTYGDKIYVLDAYRGEVQIFKETNYGNLINEAVSLRFDGDETLAVEKWRQVLKYDENFELANTGIGKSYLTAGENELAMNFLQLGMNRDYYSIAFKRFRNEILENNLSIVFTVGLALIIAFAAHSIIKRWRKPTDDEGGVWGD